VPRTFPSFPLVALMAVAVFAPAARAEDAHAGHDMSAMAMGGDVPLYTNLGHYHRAITTKSPEAQRYFDQGLTLVYSFNHEEAERAFRKAAELDPKSAACWWGVAYSLGPHVNVPALPPRTHAAREAMEHAKALVAGASPVERAMIEALDKRYVDPQPADAKDELAAETAYAEAMKGVHQKFPNDLDVSTLLAEAEMDLRPWDYWSADGKPQPGTEDIVPLLEGVLAKEPNHPGANHYYIHAVEASPHPERALPSAKRLETLVPGAGHMVHMPSHTYLELGRYQEAAKSNREAIKSDDWFTGVAHPQGFFHMYTAHNRQFLACAAMMLGRKEEAMKAARSGNEQIPFDMARQMPGTDFFFTTPYLMLTAFGQWDDMLREPAPPADFPYLDGIWHYARGLAYCAKGDAAHAMGERDSVVALAAMLPPGAMEDLNPAAMLMEIAHHVLEGHIAETQGKADDGIAHLTRAVGFEDSLRYSEPPDWLCPVRPMLGAMLLRAKRAPEAEAAYRGDLQRHPGNGWALHGVAVSLRAQGKTAEAAKFDAQFHDAWKDADYKLDMASR